MVLLDYFKDDNASQWTPAPSETPEPIVTKICIGDYVGDPYPCAKFHNDTITSLPPKNAKMRIKWLG